MNKLLIKLLIPFLICFDIFIIWSYDVLVKAERQKVKIEKLRSAHLEAKQSCPFLKCFIIHLQKLAIICSMAEFATFQKWIVSHVGYLESTIHPSITITIHEDFTQTKVCQMSFK